MFLKIPHVIDKVVTNSLREGETDNWLRWYNVLKSDDKRNMLEFFLKFETWWKDPGLSKGFDEFGVLYSIGSTARQALGIETGREYSDIDLLYVTNCPSGCFRDMKCVEAKLSSYFGFSLDQDPDKIYLNGRTERIKADLSPRTGNSLDLVIQPGVDAEAFWEKLDDKPKIALLRWTKSVDGRYGKPMP